MTLAVEVPSDELGSVASGEMWAEIYDRRRGADPRAPHDAGLRRDAAHERAGRVRARGPGSARAIVLPHHGSLVARDPFRHREPAQERRACARVVATASLELGIDIGTVDLVVQLGSPRSIAVALQRVGRSGHWIGAKPEGRLFATTRDELIECAALVHAIRGGAMDALVHPARAARHPRAAARRRLRGRRVGRRALFATGAHAPIRTAISSANDFDAVVAMLADGDRHVPRPQRRRTSTTTASTAACARAAARASPRSPRAARSPRPPTTTSSPNPRATSIGTVDEDFAVESMAGDIFLLGTTSWMIRRVEAGRRARARRARRAAVDPVLERRGLGPHDRALARGRARAQRRSTSAPTRTRRPGCKPTARSTRAGAEQAVDLRARRQGDARRRSRPTRRSSPNASSTKAAGCS